jgi:hypothetical protein
MLAGKDELALSDYVLTSPTKAFPAFPGKPIPLCTGSVSAHGMAKGCLLKPLNPFWLAECHSAFGRGPGC